MDNLTPPLISKATVNEAELQLEYNEPLDITSIPAVESFTVKVNGTVQPAPVNVVITGNTVTLTLASAVKAGNTVTLSYTPGTSPIRGTSGNSAQAFTDQVVENITVGDTAPPVLSGAAVNGATLQLIYNEPLNPTSIPSGEDFSVEINGTLQDSPGNVEILGSTVTITLRSPVKAGDTVTVSYTPEPAQSVTWRGTGRHLSPTSR